MGRVCGQCLKFERYREPDNERGWCPLLQMVVEQGEPECGRQELMQENLLLYTEVKRLKELIRRLEEIISEVS